MEILNIFEAYRALEEGKCVEDCDGTIYKKIKDIVVGREAFCEEWDTDACPVNRYSPFKIVPDPSKPEPKSLSFDEAKELFWSYKPLQVNIPGGYTRMKRSKDEDLHILLTYENYLDLAERRGWKIQQIEEADDAT